METINQYCHSNQKPNKVAAIILAGGVGSRFSHDETGTLKQMVKIGGRPIILHTLRVFETHKDIDEIIVVVHKSLLREVTNLINKNKFQKITKIIRGGKSRQESSRRGLLACGKDVQKVLIHDGVRPFVSHEIISNVINKLDNFVGVDVAIETPDTLIIKNKNKTIKQIPKRSLFMRGQTPQGFRLDVIKRAHKLAVRDGFSEVTDDCGLVLHYKLGNIYIVDGSEENIKITHPIDIHIADKLFQVKNLPSYKLDTTISLSGLAGKKIIIFGHSSGIGKEIYNLAKENNASVWGFSRSNGVDIKKRDSIKRVLSQINQETGKVDIVISTAGILIKKFLSEMSYQEIVEQIETNYIGQINVIKLTIPYIKRGGMILLFTSSSYTRGREGYSIYSSTKAAIVNLVQALSEELYEKNIYVNAISPSRTNTPMRWKNFGKESKNTLLDPKKVAKITLLVSLSKITGQIIDVRK